MSPLVARLARRQTEEGSVGANFRRVRGDIVEARGVDLARRGPKGRSRELWTPKAEAARAADAEPARRESTWLAEAEGRRRQADYGADTRRAK